MKRDNTLERAKGWLIFFVVIGHCLELSTLTYATKMHDFIYSFHMPVFVFFAGIMSRGNNIEKVSKEGANKYSVNNGLGI